MLPIVKSIFNALHPRQKLWMISLVDYRAYPGSEFSVANTLAKWKKLEPNEIDFHQGFSQKLVSRHCSVFNYLQASCDLSSADNLSKQFGTRSGPKNIGPDLDPNCLTH